MGKTRLCILYLCGSPHSLTASENEWKVGCRVEDLGNLVGGSLNVGHVSTQENCAFLLNAFSRKHGKGCFTGGGLQIGWCVVLERVGKRMSSA